RDGQSAVTTTKLTALQEAQQSLQEAARLFGEAPPPDASSQFADLFLRRAAIEFTRELLCSQLGFNHSGFEEKIDDLMNLADASESTRRHQGPAARREGARVPRQVGPPVSRTRDQQIMFVAAKLEARREPRCG